MAPRTETANGHRLNRGFVAPRRLTERKAPELFSLKNPGDLLEAVLLRIDGISIADKETHQPKRVTQYTFRRENGSVVKMLGTYDLDCKIFRDDIGRFMEVVFVGEDKKIKRGNNYMKIFRVSVDDSSPAPVPAKTEQSAEITDEDIPF